MVHKLALQVYHFGESTLYFLSLFFTCNEGIGLYRFIQTERENGNTNYFQIVHSEIAVYIYIYLLLHLPASLLRLYYSQFEMATRVVLN